MQVFSAWSLRYRPGAAKWRPRGRKMARVGSPRDPQGCPRVSQCLLKCSKKTSKISIPAPRVPRVAPRHQNTSIFDVPHTAVTPGRGNVQPSLPLYATPHSLHPPHCEASLKRGGLGVCPLGLHLISLGGCARKVFAIASVSLYCAKNSQAFDCV